MCISPSKRAPIATWQAKLTVLDTSSSLAPRVEDLSRATPPKWPKQARHDHGY
jgi:hypothetical protein